MGSDPMGHFWPGLSVSPGALGGGVGRVRLTHYTQVQNCQDHKFWWGRSWALESVILSGAAFQASQKISGASDVTLIARSLAPLVKARGFGMTQCAKLRHYQLLRLLSKAQPSQNRLTAQRQNRVLVIHRSFSFEPFALLLTFVRLSPVLTVSCAESSVRIKQGVCLVLE